MTDITGKVFSSTTIATKEEDGSWKIVVDMVERRRIGDGEWEEKKIESMCVDDTFEDAYQVAMNSVLENFQLILHENKTGSMFPEDVVEEEVQKEE